MSCHVMSWRESYLVAVRIGKFLETFEVFVCGLQVGAVGSK